MAFTYTDKNLKTVLHSWGRFRVTVSEAVQPGDALSWYDGTTYTVQLANESDSQRADCFACQEGAAGDEIWAALAVELKSASTIGTLGVVTQVYFLDSGDTLGSNLYLSSTDGKPSSSAGSTYAQIIGQALARDRIMLNVTGSATGPTFSTTITPDALDGAALGTALLAWSDLYLASGGKIDWASDITLTHSSNLLTFAGGNLRIGSTNRIEFRDAGVYLFSHVDGRFAIYVDGTAQGSILFNCGVGGTITMGNIIGLFCTTANGTANGMLWYDNTTHRLQYFSQDQVRTVVNTAQATTFTANLTISSTNKLYFRDTGVYLFSHVDGRFAIYVDGNDQAAILLSPAAGGGIRMGGYLCLHHTTTDGAYNGQIWYDGTSGTFQCRQADLVKTFTTS